LDSGRLEKGEPAAGRRRGSGKESTVKLSLALLAGTGLVAAAVLARLFLIWVLGDRTA
jgi:hypothetical protein